MIRHPSLITLHEFMYRKPRFLEGCTPSAKTCRVSATTTSTCSQRWCVRDSGQTVDLLETFAACGPVPGTGRAGWEPTFRLWQRLEGRTRCRSQQYCFSSVFQLRVWAPRRCDLTAHDTVYWSKRRGRRHDGSNENGAPRYPEIAERVNKVVVNIRRCPIPARTSEADS